MPGNFQNRQKQQYILYIILFVLFLLIFIPIIVSIFNTKKKNPVVINQNDHAYVMPLEALERKLAQEQTTANRIHILRRKNEVLEKQHADVKRLLPDSNNLYGWATEKIYEAARQTGIKLIDYHEVYKAARSNSPYQPYTLEIICEASYEKIIRFTDVIEENPLARITRLEMQGKETPPYNTKAIIQIEWPTRLRWQSM